MQTLSIPAASKAKVVFYQGNSRVYRNDQGYSTSQTLRVEIAKNATVV